MNIPVIWKLWGMSLEQLSSSYPEGLIYWTFHLPESLW